MDGDSVKKVIIPLYRHQLYYKNNTASTNRLLFLFKEVVKHDIKVEILFLNATIDKTEIFDGIKFIYYNNKTKFKILDLFRSKRILKEYIEEAKDCHISVKIPTSHNIINQSIVSMCNKLNILCFQERNEYPFIGCTFKRLKGIYNYFDLLLFKKYISKLDFIISMTTNLENHFLKLGAKEVLLLPMSVDLERFNITKQDSEDYFAYCGALNCKKDGVDVLVKAFDKFSDKYSNFYLYLIGGEGSRKEYEYILELITKSNNKNKIKLLGKKSVEEIPSLLVNAYALCLARPNSTQAEGGFPSKLGEYLATGNPVIVTNTSEITNYLNDSISAYIAKAGSVDSFYEKMKAVVEDENKRVVGANGLKVASKSFSTVAIAKKLFRRLNEDKKNI